MKFHCFVLAAALLPVAAQAQAPSGEQLFKQRCQVCHSVKAGTISPLGPNLAGVVGRKAASAKYPYSAGLKSSTLVWTRDALGQFITAPGKMVPGTRMVISVNDPAQRAAIIDYLATVK